MNYKIYFFDEGDKKLALIKEHSKWVKRKEISPASGIALRFFKTARRKKLLDLGCELIEIIVLQSTATTSDEIVN